MRAPTDPCHRYALPAGARWRGEMGLRRLLGFVLVVIAVPSAIVTISLSGTPTTLVWVSMVAMVGTLVALLLFGFWAIPQTDLKAQSAAPAGVFASPATVVSGRQAGSFLIEHLERNASGILYVGPAGVAWAPPRGSMAPRRFDASWSLIDQVGVLPQRVYLRRCLAVRVTLRDGSTTIFQTRAGARLCESLAELDAPPPRS
jgi:hypothetical protein